MNPPDLIESLGRLQGRYLSARSSAQELRDDIPKLHIFRDSITGKWRVNGSGHKGHDNEDRMDIVCHVLTHMVLPNLEKEANVAGHYNFELHDSYTYLDRDPSHYDNVMTFSKFYDHHRAICVPDLYQLGGYGGKLHEFADKTPFSRKSNGIVGAYTTTGNRNPKLNERVQACLWSLRHSCCHLNITKVAQMDPNVLFSTYPELKSITRSYVSPAEQLQNKFLLNIRGNTETWDQAWMLASNSLVLRTQRKDICWYAPAMLDKYHYIRCYDHDDILKNAQYFTNNPREAEYIIRNANYLVRDFLFPPTHALLYWVSLMEESCAS
jgi:hypothetical protein